MSIYSRTLKHVNHKDFRRTHQRYLGEQEVLRKIKEEKLIQEKKELEEIKKLSSPFKSNWREELKIAQNQREEVVEDSINKKYEWRDELVRDKSKYFKIGSLEEGMTSKDFEYLYGLSITNLQIDSSLGRVQNNNAQEIVQASSEYSEYQFGDAFPGSFVNSIGDNQIISQSKVDALAFLDTSYGDVSGGDQSYRLTTGPEGLPPTGQSPPGSVISRVNLETALGISLPNGVPNGNLDGTPIEGSAIKRVFTDARPGRRINFNWNFASSEDTLGAATVDDYAFVAIKGNVTKFVSVLTRGLNHNGQFLYTVQSDDIINGKVEIGIGIIDVFDPYVQTVLNISNFGSLWGAGTLGDTTDAADLGMSVAAGMSQSQQKKEAEKEKIQQQTKVEKSVAQYQTSLNNFVSELENLEKEFNDLKQANKSGYPTSMQDKFDRYMSNDQKYKEALYYGDAPQWTAKETEAYGLYYTMKTARQAAAEFQKKVSSGEIKVSEKTYRGNMAGYLRNAERAEKQLIDKFGFTSSDKPPSLTSQQQEKISKEIEKLKAAAKQSAIDARNNELAAAAAAAAFTLVAAPLVGELGLTLFAPSAVARVAAAFDALNKSEAAATAARELARNFQRQNPGKYNPFLSDKANQLARQQGVGTNVKGQNPVFRQPMKNSYEPQGEIILEKEMKTFKQFSKALYPGQPSPSGFPDQEPPKQLPNGFHQDYGKRANMYNTLDKISADSMPLTGDPEIDAKVLKARKQPK